MTAHHPITFVCCVESGALEVQTIRMVESVRRWGGMFATAPIIAVTPRFGAPLSAETHRRFDKLDVKHINFRAKSDYSWFKFLNKPLALIAAEKHTTSEAICWLDSDLLIVGEPDQLQLGEDEDFLGCASDKEMGTSGAGDPFEPLWQANCQAIGLDIEQLPWITTEQEGKRIRLYWNGGIFVYRRSTGFAQQYLDVCTQLLDARNITDASGYAIGTNEMSAIGLAMVKLGLRWRALPYSHDYIMGSFTHAEWYDEAELKTARIVHYHDAMWPWFYDEFVRCLRATHPEAGNWLASVGAMSNEAPLPNRVVSKILKSFRAGKEKAYLKSCHVVPFQTVQAPEDQGEGVEKAVSLQ